MAARMRAAATTASTTNWAASASAYIPSASHEGPATPARTSTVAGPSANQASATDSSARAGAVRPRAAWMSDVTSNAAATRSGAHDGGRSSSIGTNTTWVGTTQPAPAENSTP